MEELVIKASKELQRKEEENGELKIKNKSLETTWRECIQQHSEQCSKYEDKIKELQTLGKAHDSLTTSETRN